MVEYVCKFYMISRLKIEKRAYIVKKIVLLCDTYNDMAIANNYLVSKMKEASIKDSIECEIYACSIHDICEKAIDADVVLLTPLICFKQFLIEKIVDCPVEQIGIGAYANIDGQYILDKAFSKISENYVS